MSTAYCATVHELRDQIAADGLDPAQGGFFLLSSYPDVDETQFDVWSVETAQAPAGMLPAMLNYHIPAAALQRLSTDATMRMFG